MEEPCWKLHALRRRHTFTPCQRRPVRHHAKWGRSSDRFCGEFPAPLARRLEAHVLPLFGWVWKGYGSAFRNFRHRDSAPVSWHVTVPVSSHRELSRYRGSSAISTRVQYAPCSGGVKQVATVNSPQRRRVKFR